MASHGLLRLGLVGAALLTAASALSPVTVTSTLDGGAFTFALTAANFSANTDDFWTGTYYVPAEASSAPVAVYNTQSPSVAGAAAAAAGAGAGVFLPLTVFVTNASEVTGDDLRALVAAYEAEDDVFDAGFLKGVQIVSTQTAAAAVLHCSGVEYLESLGVELLVLAPSMMGASGGRSFVFNTTAVVPAQPTAAAPPPGPYVAQLGADGTLALRKVYALFSDYQEAFLNGVTANDDGSFSALGVWNTEQSAPLIPVPSRLYTSLLDPATHPLAGLRFALKDLMPVRGLVLTGGSRAYARVYDAPASDTAPAIARLLGLGAVLVGRAKLSTFAYGSYAYQNMDYSYSWNIRGDGFLGLSASSFGSAAAIAAYSQLDFAVGSDTLGSVRNPADRVGVYGMRPSWGAIDLTDVIPSASSMDTLGVMARSVARLRQVMGAWEASEAAARPANSTAAAAAPLATGAFARPTTLFYPVEWFPVNTTAAQTVIDGWLANMTAALGLQLVHQNVTALFHEAMGNDSLSLADYTGSFTKLTNYDNWQLFGKAFVADYRARFGGRWPEADNQVLTSWRGGQTMGPANKTALEDAMAAFGAFVNSKVVPADNATCTQGFWVYQIEDTGGGVPEYRDVLDYDYFPPFTPMRAASLAPFAKLVDVTVPIGTVPYDSVISMQEEELVITLSFVAHHGCDAVLMDFLAACEAAGFCNPVKTGITAW